MNNTSCFNQVTDRGDRVAYRHGHNFMVLYKKLLKGRDGLEPQPRLIF
ncbi:MAG: hypothetical protein NTY79_03725 [Chloroflexi bacterium]|nr:hypothetical protein [Chloroflexota bacterium]